MTADLKLMERMREMPLGIMKEWKKASIGHDRMNQSEYARTKVVEKYQTDKLTESEGDALGDALGIDEIVGDELGAADGADESEGDDVGSVLGWLDRVGDSDGEPVG